MPHISRRRTHRAARMVVLMLVVASGCSTDNRPLLLVHDSPRGTVSLETLPSGSLEADQPISLAESTVAQVLSGVLVKPQERLLQEILAGDAPPERAFHPEDVTFLAPLVRAALGRAGPDDFVRFQTRPSTDSGQDQTGGALYVKGSAVVFALTQYRARSPQPVRTGKADRRAPRPAGLGRYTIAFLPRGVEVPLPAAPPDELTMGEFRVLAIDYALLAKLQALDTESPPLSSSGDIDSGRANDNAGRVDLGTLKDLIIQKDVEIEALRQEVEALRRQLERTKPGQRR